MVRILVSMLVVSLGACGPAMQPREDGSEVSLRISPAAVSPGEPVELTLINRSSGSIGYNLCTSLLEERRGGEWEPVPPDRDCTMELRILEAGQSATYTLELPAELASGEYRYVTEVEHLEPGDRVAVASERFTVGR